LFSLDCIKIFVFLGLYNVDCIIEPLYYNLDIVFNLNLSYEINVNSSGVYNHAHARIGKPVQDFTEAEVET
jgi:hypothetical protein